MSKLTSSIFCCSYQSVVVAGYFDVEDFNLSLLLAVEC